MRASHRAALGVVLALAVLANACARPVVVEPTPAKAAPVVAAPSTPPAYVPLTVTVEPKHAVVRIGAHDFPTDESGSVTQPVEVGGAYFVSAVAPGYARSRHVRVVIRADDTPPLYFVLRREGQERAQRR